MNMSSLPFLILFSFSREEEEIERWIYDRYVKMVRSRDAVDPSPFILHRLPIWQFRPSHSGLTIILRQRLWPETVDEFGPPLDLINGPRKSLLKWEVGQPVHVLCECKSGTPQKVQPVT